jgi:hypothetical protein
MNSYAAERIARQRTAELQAQAARSRPADSPGPSIRNLTGWALIQVGLALVTSSARHQQATAVRPELP